MFHFYLQTPNFTDWIQALSAFGVLILTGYLAWNAKKALGVWKDQEKHKVKMQLVMEIDESYVLANDLRSTHPSTLPQHEIDKIINNNGAVGYLMAQLAIQREKLRISTEYRSRIRQLSNLAIANLDPGDSLRVYFVHINELITEISRRNNVFDNILSGWKDLSERRSKSETELKDLMKHKENYHSSRVG